MLTTDTGGHLIEEDGNVFAELMDGKYSLMTPMHIPSADQTNRDCDGHSEDAVGCDTGVYRCIAREMRQN